MRDRITSSSSLCPNCDRLQYSAAGARTPNKPSSAHRTELRSIASRVAARSASAVNYRNHSGFTDLKFRGTERNRFDACSEGENRGGEPDGRIQIKAEFEAMMTSRKFWARVPRLCSLGDHVGKAVN